jgi:glutamate carboxypeptidase
LHFGGGHAWNGAPSRHTHFHAQLIPGADRPAEFRALDSGKYHHLVVAVFYFGEQQCATRLRDGFHDQDAGHDRKSRKMSYEERLIDGDILDGDDVLFTLQFQDAVNEEKRVTVRQDFEQFVDVEPSLRRPWRRFLHRIALSHKDSKRPDDYTVRLAPEASLPWAGGAMKGKKTTSAQPNATWQERLSYFESRQDALVQTIRELVEIESPSDNKLAADRIGTFLAAKFEARGGRASVHRAEEFGDNLQIDFPGHGGKRPVLLLGHFDTVYPLGTLASMPCRQDGDRLHGPGVLDMKSGIALMLFAIEALQSWHGGLPRPVTVFLVSDEEVGSGSSRKITEDLARKSAAVLVLEPAAGLKGAVKTARKGVGEYRLIVKGVASHAGLDPGKGHSAIVELARQVTMISKLNDLKSGVSVNPGVIRGGTRTNVVAAEAVIEIDARIKSAQQAKGLDRKLRSLKPFDRHCKLVVEGGINRLPMERKNGVVALYQKAKEIARQIDWKLEEAAVGGGSDGNFTAGIGVPTLDGMGGVGEGAHAVHEYIVIPELPRRALLLASMIENI